MPSAGPVRSSVFNGARRYHGGLMPDEFPAILQKGEAVFTKDQQRALLPTGGGGGSAVMNGMIGSAIGSIAAGSRALTNLASTASQSGNVTVNNYSSSGVTAKRDDQGNFTIDIVDALDAHLGKAVAISSTGRGPLSSMADPRFTASRRAG